MTSAERERTPSGAEAPTDGVADAARAARARRRARQRRGWGARISAAVLVLFLTSFRWLPVSVALFGARRLGSLAWWLLPSRRQIADENLQIAFGDRLSPRERRRIRRHAAEGDEVRDDEGRAADE